MDASAKNGRGDIVTAETNFFGAPEHRSKTVIRLKRAGHRFSTTLVESRSWEVLVGLKWRDDDTLHRRIARQAWHYFKLADGHRRLVKTWRRGFPLPGRPTDLKRRGRGQASVAVVGSIIRRTSVILLAGKPLRRACSRMIASSWAR
jgi:hypothetical protein